MTARNRLTCVKGDAASYCYRSVVDGARRRWQMKVPINRSLLEAARHDGGAGAGEVPAYLHQVYWWAYVHPRAVTVFERDWLVNLILFGNYRRLCDAALACLGTPLAGRTLQVACVYGNLTDRIRSAMTADARLDVVDILPVQLQNLAAKLPADDRLMLRRCDSQALPMAHGSYDQTLLFFLLHEQPEAVRRATLAEALRVTKPGGRVILFDYHRPRPWHPLGPLMKFVFRTLEPYAPDLWRNELVDFLPEKLRPATVDKRTYFGGLYQRVVLTKK